MFALGVLAGIFISLGAIFATTVTAPTMASGEWYFHRTSPVAASTEVSHPVRGPSGSTSPPR